MLENTLSLPRPLEWTLYSQLIHGIDQYSNNNPNPNPHEIYLSVTHNKSHDLKVEKLLTHNRLCVCAQNHQRVAKQRVEAVVVPGVWEQRWAAHRLHSRSQIQRGAAAVALRPPRWRPGEPKQTVNTYHLLLMWSHIRLHLHRCL